MGDADLCIFEIHNVIPVEVPYFFQSYGGGNGPLLLRTIEPAGRKNFRPKPVPDVERDEKKSFSFSFFSFQLLYVNHWSIGVQYPPLHDGHAQVGGLFNQIKLKSYFLP